jgi:fructose-1,6-bisphosphatase/sedoheptulose 1,7-bisphosphatase-like protein
MRTPKPNNVTEIDDDSGEMREGVGNITNAEQRAKAQKIIENHAARIEAGEIPACVICGKTTDEAVSIAEVSSDKEITFCYTCGTGVAVSLLSGLPEANQRRVVAHYVVQARQQKVNATDMVGIELSSLYRMLNPTLFDGDGEAKPEA